MPEVATLTFPIEWVVGAGDQAMEEGEPDSVALLHYLLGGYGIEWKLVPDPVATSYWDQGIKSYKLEGMEVPLCHDAAFDHLALKYGYVFPAWLEVERAWR